MKKFFLLFSFGFILLSTSLVSCNDDNNGNSGFELTSYLDGEYSKNDADKTLTATIDGNSVSEQAKVSFRAGDFKTGSITLIHVFEGYNSIEIKDIPLQEETKDETTFLKFAGSKKVDDSFSFSYQGYILYGNLYLDLSID